MPTVSLRELVAGLTARAGGRKKVGQPRPKHCEKNYFSGRRSRCKGTKNRFSVIPNYHDQERGENITSQFFPPKSFLQQLESIKILLRPTVEKKKRRRRRKEEKEKIVIYKSKKPPFSCEGGGRGIEGGKEVMIFFTPIIFPFSCGKSRVEERKREENSPTVKNKRVGWKRQVKLKLLHKQNFYGSHSFFPQYKTFSRTVFLPEVDGRFICF